MGKVEEKVEWIGPAGESRNASEDKVKDSPDFGIIVVNSFSSYVRYLRADYVFAKGFQ